MSTPGLNAFMAALAKRMVDCPPPSPAVWKDAYIAQVLEQMAREVPEADTYLGDFAKYVGKREDVS